MGKVLNIDLGSQREIKQEGKEKNLPNSANPPLDVGKIKTNFFLPDLKLDSVKGVIKETSPHVRKAVSRINKYIENIADDYFLLGLHLISLHSLLRESKLTTDQIRSWYTDNINMPYSSAMQCRKVAEVYSENPEMITRYTASGAYLLSSCKTEEEREEIWQKAKGDKSNASIIDIREALKSARTSKLFVNSETGKIKKEKNGLSSKNLISTRKIRLSLESIVVNSENYLTCEKTKDRAEMRKILLDSVKKFMVYLEEKG